MKTTARRLAPGLYGLLRRGRKFAATVYEQSVTAWRMERELGSRRLDVAALKSLAGEKVIVVFAPEAGIASHFAADCLVAKVLLERGHRVLVVGCYDVYPRCVVMDSKSLPAELTPWQRRKACLDCARQSLDMTGTYGLPVVELRDLIDAEARISIDRLMAELPQDISTFELDGIPFGKISAAEAAVTLKVADFAGVDPKVRSRMMLYLHGSLLSYFAMRALMGHVRVVSLVHYNEYAMLLGAVLAARAADLPTINMAHASVRGVDRRLLSLRSDVLAITSYRARLAQWSSWRDLPLRPTRIAEVGDDGRYRISGNSTMVYSPVRSGAVDDLFQRFSLSSKRRLLVAFTSSLDEIEANGQLLQAMKQPAFSDRQPFSDQVAWLKVLIDRVESSDGLQLIVRIHPREGANRREAEASRHLETLRENFSRTFNHVRFVWPGEVISSYDLMEMADVGLSAWSSTAIEMARFGLPSVIAFDRHTPMPIGDFVTWSDNADGYFRCIDEALRRGPSLDPVRYAYRWSSLHLLGCAVDLSDLVPSSDSADLPVYRTPAVAEIIEDVIVRGRSMVDINRMELLARDSEAAEADEREALMTQLRRNIWFLSCGSDRADDYRLFYGRPTQSDLPEGYDAAVFADGRMTEFRTRDLKIRRGSRMVERMAVLCAQNMRVRHEEAEVARF